MPSSTSGKGTRVKIAITTYRVQSRRHGGGDGVTDKSNNQVLKNQTEMKQFLRKNRKLQTRGKEAREWRARPFEGRGSRGKGKEKEREQQEARALS